MPLVVRRDYDRQAGPAHRPSSYQWIFRFCWYLLLCSFLRPTMQAMAANAFLHVQMSPKDKQAIDEAARRSGQPVSWWVRRVLAAAAAETKPAATQERTATT